MRLQSGGVRRPNDRGRYERAYREQANVLARTEMRARQAGCFGAGSSSSAASRTGAATR